MIYDTFYAKLVPNGAVTGTKYSVSISGVTAIVDGQKTYTGADMYFAITPKSSGRATVTFKNDNTGDVIGTRQMLVRSLTLAKPTYSLTSSATSVNEGGTVTFTLDTSDVPVNSTFAYSVTGISAADLESGTLTGNFTVTQDGTATVSFTLKADELTEGTETMTLSIASLNLSKAVTINDTSMTPTYDINWYGEARGTGIILTDVPEGGAPYLVIKTTNVPDGTVFDFNISGVGVNPSDFQEAPLSGQITVTNGLGYHIYRSTRDRLTEGDEVVTATVKRNGVVVGTPKFTLVDDSVPTTYTIGVYDSITSVNELTVIEQAPLADATFIVGTFTDSSGDFAGYLPVTRPMGTLIEGTIGNTTLTQCTITKNKPDLLCIIIDAQWDKTPLYDVPVMIKLTNLSTNESYLSNSVVFTYTGGWGSWIWVDTVSAVSLVTRIFTKDQRVKLEFLQ